MGPCITGWGHVPSLDGGLGDHDHADFETGTATPDDDDGHRLLRQSIVRIYAAIKPQIAWFWLHGQFASALQ